MHPAAPHGSRPPAPPVYDHAPEKLNEPLLRRLSLWVLLDNLYFALASLCVVLLAVVLFRQSLSLSANLLYLIAFWAVLSYLGLPRVHRLLTAIYVPGYFIGRSHTGDGLLGDPVNLAVRGTEAQIHEVMAKADWVRADPITARSAWGIVVSSVLRRSYPEAPVSSLFLFGRMQAFAYQQEVDGNAAQRHHVRFWPTPDGWLLPGGHRVDWIAAGTYDRAVGLSLFTWQVTHKIDADIDIERDYIVDTVRYASGEVGVSVLENFSTGYHSRNGGGDVVRTDGDLPILELSQVEAPPEQDVDGARGGRPPALLLGVLLVGLAALLEICTYLPSLRQQLAETAADSVGTSLHTLVIAAVAVLVNLYLIEAFLLWRTYAGRRWARLCVLSVLCVQVLVQLFQWAGLPQGSLSITALASTSLYVLAVYALSSLSVRTWTSPGKGRRHPAATTVEVS